MILAACRGRDIYIKERQTSGWKGRRALCEYKKFRTLGGKLRLEDLGELSPSKRYLPHEVCVLSMLLRGHVSMVFEQPNALDLYCRGLFCCHSISG